MIVIRLLNITGKGVQTKLQNASVPPSQIQIQKGGILSFHFNKKCKVPYQ
jgi:hypothetical protein